MKVETGVITSKILESSPEEISSLKKLLTEFDDDGVKTLLYKDNSFPTGILGFVENAGFEVDVVNPPERLAIRDIKVDSEILNGISLRDYQVSAVRKSMYFKRGIIEACTGSGKTAMIAATIRHMQEIGMCKQFVVFVPTGFLMQQHSDNFEEWGLSVGRVGYGNKYKPGFDVYVSVIDSAYKAINTEHCPWAADADALILDEAHYTKSQKWFSVCSACEKAEVRLAFTATAFENPEVCSYEDLQLMGQTGQVLMEVKSSELRRRGLLADPLLCFIRTKSKRILMKNWTVAYRTGIVYNKVRNSIISSIAASCYRGRFKVLTFVSQKKHGEKLCELTAKEGVESVLVQGGGKVKIYSPSGAVSNHKWDISDLARYVNENESAAVFATTVLDEGIDVPIINVLIMAGGMKKYRRTVQRLGRGMRAKKGQNRVFVFDFWDQQHFFLANQSKYREWTYKREEIEFGSIEQVEEAMETKIDIVRTAK